MNFAREPQVVPGHGRHLRFATHEGADLRPDGAVALPALAGALVQGAPVGIARPKAGAAL
jgi:hypothetical protein